MDLNITCDVCNRVIMPGEEFCQVILDDRWRRIKNRGIQKFVCLNGKQLHPHDRTLCYKCESKLKKMLHIETRVLTDNPIWNPAPFDIGSWEEDV